LATCFLDEDGAGDATDEGFDVGLDGIGERLQEREIGDGDAATRLEDAGDFAPDAGLVGGEVEDAVGDDDIDG